ncbi:MAG: hypothetical protein IPK26_22590 [Planctomycetes bacterium]|nr:hypothetical protein [Planctomycetota bacterium]
MSKWRRDNYRLRYRNPERVERARQIRADRQGPGWTRPFGWLLLVLAASFALDPDYPLPRHLLASGSSAEPGPELRWNAPQPVFPLGTVTTSAPRFVWNHDGPPWPHTLVLLDEQFEEIARLPQTEPGTCRVDGPLGEALLAGKNVHWYVEASTGRRSLRSSIGAARISR